MKETELLLALQTNAITRKDLIQLEKEMIAKAMKYLKGNVGHLVVIAYEETAELQQALTKTVRGKGNRISVLEEYVDVLLSIKYMAMVYNINIDIYKKYKADEKFDAMKVCNKLSELQKDIYRAMNGEVAPLKPGCIKALKAMAGVKKEFDLADEEIDKIMLAKIKRLESRVNNGELV